MSSATAMTVSIIAFPDLRQIHPPQQGLSNTEERRFPFEIEQLGAISISELRLTLQRNGLL